MFLRAVLFDAQDDADVEGRLNGTSVQVLTRDSKWKDPQIFSPRPQPASGGKGDYRINPRQRLLRLDFTVDPTVCLVGRNIAGLRLKDPAGGSAAATVQLEKLELWVRYDKRE